MTTLTIQTPQIHPLFPPLLNIEDVSVIAVFIAEMADTLEARRAVAAITARIAARIGSGGALAPDARDVPLVVRQREFALAARAARQLEQTLPLRVVA